MAKKEVKNFPLRLINKNVYPALEKMANDKYTSVNSLINIILEKSLKKEKIN